MGQTCVNPACGERDRNDKTATRKKKSAHSSNHHMSVNRVELEMSLSSRWEVRNFQISKSSTLAKD